MSSVWSYFHAQYLLAPYLDSVSLVSLSHFKDEKKKLKVITNKWWEEIT